ncbi:hypothetical protein ACVWVY_007810 [Bradyrhizobium sp. URHC0002]
MAQCLPSAFTPRIAREAEEDWNAKPTAEHNSGERRRALTASKRSPAKAGLLDWPAVLDRYFLLEPESVDEFDDVLWFTLGWLDVDELPLCEGDWPVVLD